MSRTVQCCPTCDGTSIYTRTGAYDYPDVATPTDSWRCGACGETFETPSERLAYQPSGYSGLTARLLAIDPDADLD